MEQEFRNAYRQLNTAQKEAVDTIDGPVLVVAGPGTGKTQLLSLRVANILQKTDTDPSSVLCLTFTNLAATNMSDRLNKYIGASAHNVVVRTFHSFAAEIMALYPDYFWNGARLQVAPDAVQLEIIQSILEKLPLDNPLALKFAGNFTAINDVQQALKLTKEAGLSPAKLASMLAVNQAYIDLIEPELIGLLSSPLSLKKLDSLSRSVEALPDQPIDTAVTPLISLSKVIKESLAASIEQDQASGKTLQTGKWKRRWIQSVNSKRGMFDERRRNGWWLALAEIYEKYRERLHLRGYYDYSDMIIEVITQLEQEPELLASMQERFLYVLIDEFQDSNAAQMRLAHLITNSPGTEGRPNLMAVGDDDQSIFAFNGAELNNMLSFRRIYPKTKTIVLVDNYRSTQKILDMAQTIIEQADDRLVTRDSSLNKHLKAKVREANGIIEHGVYPTQMHQLNQLAKRIQRQWNETSNSEIAVLARQHSSLRNLSSELARLGVPIRYEQQNNVLEQPLVAQVLLLSEIINAIARGDENTLNYNLPILLPHEVWQIKSQDLWKLATTNFARPDWLGNLAKSKNVQLSRLHAWLIWLSRQSKAEPLAVMLEYIVGLRTSEVMTSPLKDYFVNRQKIDGSYIAGLSGLSVLLNIASEFALSRVGKTTLDDFVRLIRVHRDLGRPITDESWFTTGDNAIQLLTVHKAKGLEFDTVYLLDAVDSNWRPRRGGRKPPANLPLQPYGEIYDDYVRLLYVAATRARHSMITSSYQNDAAGNTVLATPLLNSLPEMIYEPTGESDSISSLEQSLSWPRLESSDEKRLLGTRLETYQLSATGLLQFLDVASGGPQNFLEHNILKIPTARTPLMAYGTAIHKSLQAAQLLVNSGKSSLNKIISEYAASLDKQQLPVDEHDRYQEHGTALLNKLFKENLLSLEKGGQPEIRFDDIRIGSARLKGAVDHLNLSDDRLVITDYKTGKPLASFETRNRLKAMKAWRHKNQLLFYCLLATQSGRFKKTSNVLAQMVYLEAENPKSMILKLDPDKNDLDRLLQLIEVVWRHVMNLDFPDVRHYTPDTEGIRSFENDLLSGKI